MKTLLYLLLLVGYTSCTTYNASSQIPSQYTSVTEQIMFEQPCITYTSTFTFASYYTYTYYNWGWRRYYFTSYPIHLDTWNPYPRRWFWNYYAWNPHHYWTYNPYNWNYSNWHHNNYWHHNNWYYPNNYYSPFFSPVAQSNHNKLTNYKKVEVDKQYTSKPVVDTRRPDRTTTYTRKDYSNQQPRREYQQPTRSYQQPTRYTRPQATQPRTQPTRQPSINIQRKSYGQPRSHSRNR